MEKWQTFPCGSCLLKNNCNSTCFKWPAFGVTSQFVRDNFLQGVCLACGADNHVEYYKETGEYHPVWWCRKCRFIER